MGWLKAQQQLRRRAEQEAEYGWRRRTEGRRCAGKLVKGGKEKAPGLDCGGGREGKVTKVQASQLRRVELRSRGAGAMAVD